MSDGTVGKYEVEKAWIYAGAAVVMVIFMSITSYCGFHDRQMTERWKAHTWEGKQLTPFQEGY